MEMRMDIIGDEIVVEGQVVGVLKPGLGASMRQHVEDSLRGLVLDDWSNKGTIQTEIDWDKHQERVGKFVKFVRGLLKRGRANRRELVVKANARVNELKAQIVQMQTHGVKPFGEAAADAEADHYADKRIEELEGWIGQWQAANQALSEQLATALRERDEARAWAESTVKQAWEQGIAYGQQVSFTCSGR